MSRPVLWTEERLAGLERRDGFRLRGGEMTRLEALTDAAFALALTFLVISQQQAPQTFAELLTDFRQVPAFAASFAILIVLWRGHVRWSRRYGLDDGMAVALSCLVIFLVLIFVYPLKMVFGAAFGFVSGGWLPGAQAFTTQTELRELFIAYGIGLMLLELAVAGLYLDALRRADALGLDARERFETGVDIWFRVLAGAIGALAATVALLLPARLVGLSGDVYVLFFVLHPLYRRYQRRRRRALGLDAPA